MEHMLLKDVNVSSQNCYVVGRVVRFTDFMGGVDKKTRIRMELVIVDAEGNLMEAQVPEYWHRRPANKLVENEIYVIKYFHVIPPKTSFRVVDRECMIQFTPITTVQQPPSYPNNFPLYGYSYATFDMMRTRIGNITLTSDTVVILVASSHARDQNTSKNGMTRLRNIRVSDGTETVDVALWGKHADLFDAEGYMSGDIQKPIILLLCGVTCKTYNGNLCLSSSAGCKWYINPDIEQAHSLRTSFSAQVPQVEWLEAPQRAPEIQAYTVAEVASLADPTLLQKKQFMLTAQIREIDPTKAWSYVACNKCYKGVRDYGGVYKCSDYSCSSADTSPRYRLTVKVTDPHANLDDAATPSIYLVFFGPTAEELIGLPVHELMSRADEMQRALPVRIENLCGKIVTVRVGTNRFSFQTLDLSLQVKSIVSIRSAGLQGALDSAEQPQVADKTDDVTTPIPESKDAGKMKHDICQSSVDAPSPETPLTETRNVEQRQEATNPSNPKDMTPPGTSVGRQCASKGDSTTTTYKRSDQTAKRRLILDNQAGDK